MGIINFQRSKNVHYSNYTEHLFFKEFKNFSPKDYSIVDVAKSIGFKIKYGLDNFPESEMGQKEPFAIIEVKNENDITIHLTTSEDKTPFEYDSLNCCLSIITEMLLPNIEQYKNQYILIGEKEMLMKAFFKKYYLNKEQSIHKDIAFQMNRNFIKNTFNRLFSS